MSFTLIGQKRGMTQVFDVQGSVVVCTVIEVTPNPIVQLKQPETDGYTAVQLGGIALSESRARNQSKSLKARFAKAGVITCVRLKESKIESVEPYQVGQFIDLSSLDNAGYVDVQSVSKGKGYQGVMKLHNFAGGPASHGSGFHRHAGSTGQRSTPGRCFPNGKRASRMGGRVQTVQNLRVVAIRGNLLLVEGAVAGSRGSVVYVKKAVKKRQKAQKIK